MSCPLSGDKDEGVLRLWLEVRHLEVDQLLHAAGRVVEQDHDHPVSHALAGPWVGFGEQRPDRRLCHVADWGPHRYHQGYLLGFLVDGVEREILIGAVLEKRLGRGEPQIARRGSAASAPKRIDEAAHGLTSHVVAGAGKTSKLLLCREMGNMTGDLAVKAEGEDESVADAE